MAPRKTSKPTPDKVKALLTGRPSEYTEDRARVICDRIATGQSLREICLEEDQPSTNTVFRWLSEHASFRDQYATARELQAESHADAIVYIADTEPDPAKARVRILARQWHAAKLKPKKYGDRLDVNPDADLPMNVVTTRTNEQRAKAMAALLSKRRSQGNG